MAARRERGLLDPDAAQGESIFDHQIYVLASDGDIEEGVTSEASSLAGTQRLGNLTVIYDHNHISIEDDTNIALSEDTAARYEAYGWHVQSIDWTNDGTQYEENVPALLAALEEAREVTDRPSFISLRTIIGWPAPNQAEHRQGPRQRARRRRGGRHQEDARLRPGPDLRGGRRGHRPHPDAAATGARQAQDEWQPPSTRGRRPTPTPRRSTTGWSPTS